MSSRQITISAALYFDRDEFKSVPLTWLERARELFVEHSLSPVLFTARGGEFEFDDGYTLARCGTVSLWGETFPARGAELIEALRNGVISTLGLESPRSGATDREDWRVHVSACSLSGMFYAGMDDDLMSSPAMLLRRVHGMVADLLPVRYGIAYRSPLDQHPELYAMGSRSHSVSEVFNMIRRRADWDRRAKHQDELWNEELSGEKKHLGGLFRGHGVKKLKRRQKRRQMGTWRRSVGQFFVGTLRAGERLGRGFHRRARRS